MSAAVERLRSWKPDAWPALHQQAWAAAQEPGDLLHDGGGAAANWRPRSRSKTATGYGLWLAWNSAKGEDVSGAPEVLVARERVLAWLSDVTATSSSSTVACRAQELFDAIRVMVPGRERSWLRTISERARRKARPSRNKVERLRSAQEIDALGLSLMQQAHDPAFAGTRRQQALQMRVGLIISLLIARLLRLKNLTQITIDQHLVRHCETMMLVFDADEMKGKRAMQASFPARLMPWLTLYLEVYRPVLLGDVALDHGRLWVSATGTPLSEGRLNKAVCSRTRDAFGKPIPPHWFRDAGMTTLVIHAPRHACDARELLDHSSSATAEKHYNQAQAHLGLQRYHAVLAGFMSEADEV